MLQAKLRTRLGEFCVVPRAPSVTKDTFFGAWQSWELRQAVTGRAPCRSFSGRTHGTFLAGLTAVSSVRRSRGHHRTRDEDGSRATIEMRRLAGSGG